MTSRTRLCHCEERSDEAISSRIVAGLAKCGTLRGTRCESSIINPRSQRYQTGASIAGLHRPVKGLRGDNYGPGKLRIAGRAGSRFGASVIEVTVRREKATMGAETPYKICSRTLVSADEK
jgi:hypothetical protein